MSVRLFLFGPPRWAQQGGLAALGFERRSQLLVHLALRRGSASRAELAALLWPQAPMEQAYASLRTTLFRLRSLPWAPAIVVQDQLLAFGGTSDVADFESAIAERRWADALQIADAPLLAGYDDDASEPWSAWLRAERERLRSAWRVAAVQSLATAALPADVLKLTSLLLTDDPLDEAALGAQMRAYAQLGHPSLARDAYRSYAKQLGDDTGVAPSAQLQALHDALGPVAAQRAGPASPHGEADRRIIGRTTEQRAVRARLDEGCRLLCLMGPGGVGKSTLALHLSSELATRYADGSVYVPLDDVASPDGLGTRLARELAVPLGGGDPLQAVTAFLHGRQMLLVLDNFEHLQDAAPQLQTLLDACPRLQMLVTSRVRLGLSSERLLPLDGLACPEAEDVDRFEAFDAVQLFVRAAREVEPALQPVAESSAIAEICRLVDGLPLALEIAAAWTRVLSCEAIAAELRQGVGLLTEPDTARPERHASMAAVFEQSWQRLSLAERSVWSRMTVFHGGFTPDAARVVAGASLPVLAALTDRSLLRKAGSRNDLHPLLRQLAADRLTDDEREASSKAHAEYYLRLLAQLRSRLSIGDKQALQQVDVEFENIRAAWRCASLHGPADALQSAVLPLMRFFDAQGRVPEGLALLREAAAGIGPRQLGPVLEATMAHLEMRWGRFAEAQLLAKRALRASRQAHDDRTRMLCYRTMGTCALEMGRLPTARRRYRQNLALAAVIDPDSVAGVRHNLATVEKELGHYDAARMLYRQALVDNRPRGDVTLEALCLSNMAVLEMDADQLDAAAVHLEASLALSEQHALAIMKMMALIHLTDLAVRRHDAAAAQRHGQRAFELVEQTGSRGEKMHLHLHLAQLAMQQRDLAAARDELRAFAESAIQFELVPAQVDCVLCFANLLSAQGVACVALRLLRYAIDHPATTEASRNRARRRMTEWSSSRADAAAMSAPAVDLWTLLHRIVTETPTAHAALIESLRAP